MAREFDAFGSRVRDVLLNEWDPNNAAGVEAARGTYDGEVEPLVQLIQAGASEQALVDWLADREKQIMCFPSLGTERLRRIAQLLLKARA